MTREQIGTALEYKDPKPAIAKIHERYSDRLNKYSGVVSLVTPGGLQQTTIYNRKGIMEICRFSRQPKADAFMDWVWDVMDSVITHGAYLTPDKIEEVLLNPDTIIQLATSLKVEREAKLRLEAEVLAKEKIIEAQKPKVIFADSVSASSTTILIGELAKIMRQNGIQIGEKRLFAWLRENGYLIKRKGTDYNSPTQYSMNLGLFIIKETSITHADGSITISKTSKVTGKGQLYFVNKFKALQESADKAVTA